MQNSVKIDQNKGFYRINSSNPVVGFRSFGIPAQTHAKKKVANIFEPGDSRANFFH